MKKIKKLKLTHLNELEMDSRQQNALKGGGGGYCICVSCLCQWDECGCIMDCTEEKKDVTDDNKG